MLIYQRVNRTYTQISDGLDLLVNKISKLGLSAEIISPLFKDKINGKVFTINSETMPLAIILSELIAHIYGQLGRCYFDRQKGYVTASICELYDQIFNGTSNGEDKKIIHKALFDEIEPIIHKVSKYEGKLTTYCNKHYAHTDIKSIKNIEADYIELSTPWNEVVNLINDAKILLRKMCLVWQNTPCDFSENVYEDYKNQFWKLINFAEIKITKHSS